MTSMEKTLMTPPCELEQWQQEKPHPVPSERFRFLLVGAGRGGTSLLAALLDTHSDLEVGFERHAEDILMGKAMSAPDRDSLHKRVNAFVCACNQDVAASEAKFWGNKITTEQIFGLEDHNLDHPNSRINVLDAFFNQYFRQRRVVFILRDGRACVLSKVKRAGRTYDLACERWRYSVTCYRFFREQHANSLCIRFEDLLYEPALTLRSVCAFLGVAYEPEMLAGVASTKLRPEYRHAKFDTLKATSPDFPDEYLNAIRDDLLYCGYPIAKPAG